MVIVIGDINVFMGLNIIREILLRNSTRDCYRPIGRDVQPMKSWNTVMFQTSVYELPNEIINRPPILTKILTSVTH